MSRGIFEVIKERRSIRKFKKTKVEREKILTILEAGNFAPSGHNTQPWYFTVVENSKLIDEMNMDTKELLKNLPIPFVQTVGKNTNFHIFYHAPQIIIVSSKEEGITPVEDVSAAIQNMLLAAESLEVGTCWVGYIGVGFINEFFLSKWKQLLLIPEKVTPHYAIALGYSDMRYLKPLTRKKKENITIIE